MQWPLPAEMMSSSPFAALLGAELAGGTLGTLALRSAIGATLESPTFLGAGGEAAGERVLVGVTVEIIARLSGAPREGARSATGGVGRTGRYSCSLPTEKYLASGWWKTMAETDASG